MDHLNKSFQAMKVRYSFYFTTDPEEVTPIVRSYLDLSNSKNFVRYFKLTKSIDGDYILKHYWSEDFEKTNKRRNSYA